MTQVRLALLSNAPIYYASPLYRRIAADNRVDFTAIFASNGGVRPHDAGYGLPTVWDEDLLAGYKAEFLRRATQNPIQGSFLSLRDPDIVSKLIRGRYEVLWLHGYNFLTYLLAACTFQVLRRPRMFREEQTLLHRRSLSKSVAKYLGLRLLFSGASALYIGTQNRRWFHHYGVSENKMFFVPYCVDNERLQAEARILRGQKAELRESFGISPDAGPVIVSVMRLIPKKQPLFLLEAFRRLRSFRRCALLVVGAGELEGQMKETVEQGSIPDVRFTGFLNQSQVPRAYASGDIFVLASREHETWGLTVNEAMNFSLPVVVSDKVGSGADLVRPGANGSVFSWNDPTDLVDQLDVLVRDADLRRSYGDASLEIVSNWNHDVAARGVLEAVEKAVGPRRWAAAGVSHADAPGVLGRP